jgi:hypothetical protein
MKVYIAGPMTGIEDYNFPAFNAAADSWRAVGWDVINPAELDGEDTSHPWDFYLRRDLKLLVDCDAIAQLPGWENSKGARLETHVAEALGLSVYDALKPIVLRPIAINGESNPRCIWCQAPTQRTGMCFTCIQCGATTSC